MFKGKGELGYCLFLEVGRVNFDYNRSSIDDKLEVDAIDKRGLLKLDEQRRPRIHSTKFPKHKRVAVTIRNGTVSL